MKVKVPVYEMLIDESDDSDLMVDFIALVDKPAIQKDFMKFADENGCPVATQDIGVNLKNRQKSIDIAHYGPINPNLPSVDYWERKAKQFNTNIDEAKKSRCGNCAFFDVSPKIKDCIAQGIGNELDPYNVIDAGDLGYCEAFDFKCASSRTCDAWVVGGPIEMRTDFINPSLGEHKTEFLPRCISYVINEGKETEQAVAICNSIWNEHFAEESYSDYPDAVKNNAKAALKYADENGWGSCGTEIGKIRANQLAKGEAISFDTIKRMYSYLSRHAVDLESSKGYGDGCGKLMYDAWGGKSALTWAESKINQIERKAFAIQSEEQRIISGPLMVANQRIKRYDEERGEYEVFFSPATIKKIAIKLAKKGFQNNVNLMHSADMQLHGVTLFEIFQSDKERGIMPMKGFEDLADGSLFGSMYVDNDQAWELIKDGKVKGFSVEGNFGMKSKDKYDEQMQQIISILSETN